VSEDTTGFLHNRDSCPRPGTTYPNGAQTIEDPEMLSEVLPGL